MPAKLGDWNAICDVCGFKKKASELRKRWDGLMVCEDDWETRHPSDLYRFPTSTESIVPWTKPESSDYNLDPTFTELIDYRGYQINLTGGAGSTQSRYISSYNSGIITVSKRWATNDLSYTEQFDNAAWTKEQSSIAANVLFKPGEAVDTNLIANSENMLDASWTGTATRVDNGDGTFTLTDTDVGAWQYRQAVATIKPYQPFFIALEAKKDSIPRATRYSQIKVVFTGGGSHSYAINYDTQTGEYILGSTGTAHVLIGSGVIDAGDYWRVWMALYSTDASDTGIQYQYFPAVGSGVWVSSASITGSATVRHPQIGLGDQLRDYLGTTGTAVTATQSADALIENTAASPHSVLYTTPAALQIGDNTLWAVDVHAGLRTKVSMYCAGNAFTDSGIDFDLIAGTATVFQSPLEIVAYGIENLGGGWYRCWMVDVVDVAATGSFYCRLVNSGGLRNYTGDGKSHVYVARAQVERGVTSLGDYIATTGTTVTLPDNTTTFSITETGETGTASAGTSTTLTATLTTLQTHTADAIPSGTFNESTL